MNAPATARRPDEIHLGQIVGALAAGRLTIAVAVFVAVAVVGAYAFIAEPRYSSDVLLQVEEKGESLSGLNELTSMFTGQTPAETEIEILRSRSLLGSVVSQLRLDIDVRPRRFPLLGGAVARAYEGEGPRPAVLGLASFGWGGERLVIEELVVPRRLEGKPLTLIAGEGGRFELKGLSGEPLLSGAVGQQAAAGDVQIFVSALEANSGTRFEVVRYTRNAAIAAIQERLRTVERGKKTGVLQVSLSGTDRDTIVRTLDAIAHAYLRQNVERRSEEAEKTLEFLNTQLPTLKNQLNAAEAALNDYRSTKGIGSVNLTMEAQAALDQIVDVEKKLSELEVQRSDLRRRFTESHPVLLTIERQVKDLTNTRTALNDRLKQLPNAELETARLMRDVRVADELYLLLLNKAQELRVVKSGTIGNVRILDTAFVPDIPEWPRRGLLLSIALLLGLVGGVGLVLFRRTIFQGLDDPEEVERLTGVSVFAAILHSAEHAKREREHLRGGARTIGILAATNPSDIVTESFRSLRTSVQFALSEAKGKVVAISGPSPEIGKSFVSVNLAQVLADGGSRVLLIDCDLRRGKLNRYFDQKRKGGLAELIVGQLKAEEAIRATSDQRLSFLACGEFPPNPSELLLSARFRECIEALSARFDVVLIDTPPILAVTDAALVAHVAHLNLVVLRAGRHSAREVAQSLHLLTQNGGAVGGIVMNDVVASVGRQSGAYYYRYEY